jgi:integrase
VATRQPKRVTSPRHQVRYFFLHRGEDGRGARAIGLSRHAAKTRTGNDRLVSVGKVHSERSLEEYLRAATRFAEWAYATYGEKRVPEMLKHPEWGRAWVAALRARGLAPATQQSYLGAVIKLVEVVCPGRRDAWVAARGATERRRHPGDRAWSDQERAALLARVAARDPEAGLALRVIDATGARIAEVVRHSQHWHHALHAGQVEDGQLRLLGKGGKERRVPLPADLAAELAERAAAAATPAALLFPAVTSHRLYRLLREACAATGIRADGAHAFRYAYAQREYARLVAAGVEASEADLAVSRLLGHSRPRITHHYLGRGARS